MTRRRRRRGHRVATAILSPILLLLGSCEEKVAPAQAAPPQAQQDLSCYLHAKERTLLGEGNAFLLCRGAEGLGPVQCYEAGDDRTLLSRRQLFDLCRCARSQAPVECFERAENQTFLSQDRIIELCSPVAVDNLAANCQPLACVPPR